ncbi:MAG: C1 family peptidase [candidate division Zixibacteria bacterium]|nr:C1 family peptidase [candidate division Zixibacteria bacterium]
MRRILLVGIIGLVALAATGLAQNAPDRATVDQKVIEIQKQIDQKGYHWTAGRTSTAEMPLDEFRLLLGEQTPKGYDEWLARQPKLTAAKGKLFPTYFDWRDSSIMTPVKNQAGCGSCWAFGSTGAFEANVKKHDGVEYDLAEQQVLSCNIYGSSCAGGWAEPVYELFQRYGAVAETCMPYQADDAVPCTQDACSTLVKLGGWQYVDNTVEAIKTALLIGPVNASFTVYEDFKVYESGCYEYAWGDYLGGHLIAIVGWDDNACGAGEGAWICKNSWGDWWGGLGGYFMIKWDNCGIGRNTVLPLYPPAPVTIAYESNQAVELTGDGDGAVEPGETATVSVSLRNTGLTTATSVMGTLQTTKAGVTITDEEAIIPDMPYNEVITTQAPHFAIQIDTTVASGSQIDFTLTVNSDQGNFIIPMYLVVGKFTVAFFDDMEKDESWTHGGTSDEWARGVPTGGCMTDPSSAHSPDTIWGTNLNGSYAAGADMYLTSPAIDCSSIRETRLQFRRWLAVEKGIYDQARIFVNDNLVWENNADLDHIDFQWEWHDVDISAFADGNSSVTLKFQLISDGGLQLGGWNIDDLAVVGIEDYIIGDANGDAKVNIGDAVYIISYIFRGGPAPSPMAAGDANCDAKVNIGDAVYIITYIFRGGPVPGC